MKTIENIMQSNIIKKFVARPIISEFPFFCLFTLAISIIPIRFIPTFIHYLYIDRLFYFFFLDFPRTIAISYLFTLLVFYSHNKIIKLLLYTFGAILYTTCLFLHLVFHKTLQPDIITLIAETNANETSEFLSSFLFSIQGIITICLLFIYIALVVVCEHHKKYIAKHLHLLKHRLWAYTLLLLIILDGFFQFKIYYDIFTAKSVDNMPDDYGSYDSVTILPYSLYSIYLVHKDMKRAVEVTKQAEQTKEANIEDSLNIVLVIGESYIKHHSQLYGYNLPTTPYLCQERKKGNLFVFDNVVSPFNQTSMTIKNTLCCNSLRMQEKWSEHPYLPALFKKAGYDVYFWDVQKDNSTQALFEFSLNSFVYNKELSEVSYTQISKNHFQYDDQAVCDFSKEGGDMKGCNFVMFHLMGQHIAFNHRYPHGKQFDKFSYRDIKNKLPYLDNNKRQMIAEYDNATLYNDYVLKHIIDLFREKNAVILYYSDHGEEVYDYRDSFGRRDFDSDKIKEGLKCQHEIPFMIWCSNQYIAKYPSIVEEIGKALHRPFRTDDVCQVLFHLSHLRSDSYKETYDLLSPHYQVYDRKVGELLLDYDKIIKGK